jgi:predicted glutamine amidotransferase
MCRIFGFRSILSSGVHRSLTDAENSILQQSQRHPDGWGVAYYHMGHPHVIKLDQTARDCQIFARISGLVSSNTLLAHIRKSTVGSLGPLNTHPFHYGPWIFAHNGNIKNFSHYQKELYQKVAPQFQPYILGETDSELIFYLLLTHMKSHGLLSEHSQVEQSQWNSCLNQWLLQIQQIVGPITESNGDYDQTYLTFVLTDGRLMLAFNGGQALYYSTHKHKCSVSGDCDYFKKSCEAPVKAGSRVQHFLVSSEIIQNENQWSVLAYKNYTFVDRELNWFSQSLA